MAQSPNYGWTEPDNTGLVKNGAQDMRTLGDAIDTSVWNIGFGQAGKNKIINGDFGIFQRGTSASISGYNVYGTCDRFNFSSIGGTATASRQSFTPGSAPVAGYESQYFSRLTLAASGTTYFDMVQWIEDVRSFAGQTVTFSYYAKASTPLVITPVFYQNFGSGGSAQLQTNSTPVTLTTSWVRYTHVITVPSITGKTVGAGSKLGVDLAYTSGGTLANATFDTWGWQVEYGSKATPFQTASGGSPQAELAMCQRYYQASPTGISPAGLWSGNTTLSSVYYSNIIFPVQMRSGPTCTVTISAASGFTTATFVLAAPNFVQAASTATSVVTGGYYTWSFTASAEL
jgi:hypothetical protein